MTFNYALHFDFMNNLITKESQHRFKWAILPVVTFFWNGTRNIKTQICIKT